MTDKLIGLLAKLVAKGHYPTPDVLKIVDGLSNDETVQFYAALSALDRAAAVKVMTACLDQNVSDGILTKDSTGRYWSVEKLEPKGSA